MKSKAGILALIVLLASLLLTIAAVGPVVAQEPDPTPRATASLPPSPDSAQPTSHTFNSETTSLGDGRYRVRIGTRPQYYQDAEGVWRKITLDLRLETIDTKAEYVSDRGLVHVRLPARLGAGAIQVNATAYVPSAPENANAVPAPANDSQECSSSDPSAARACTSSELKPALSLPDSPTPKVAPLTVSGGLAWTPLGLKLTNASGQQEIVGQVDQVEGVSQGNVLTYPHTFAGVAERFTVQPDGLKHEVILASPEALPAAGLTQDVFLDYEGSVVLSPGLEIYVAGVRQDGDFRTASALELRDASGRPVLYLPPVVAYEQANPLHRVGGRYTIHHTSSGLLLSFGVPYAWLADPQREYPVVIDPTVHIWPPAADALIWSSYPSNNYETYPELWVGNVYRSLMVWDLSALPARAMIDDSEAFLNLTNNSGPAMNVSAYALTSSWTESGVTWNSRNGANNWSTAGGDFDPFVEDVVSVGTEPDNLYSWALSDLVAEWHSSNRPNYGILLQPASYPASATKMFGAKENGGWKPQLDVTYTAGPVTLSAYTPVMRPVPSPDWYSFSRGVYWNAVAIRGPAESNYDLWLSSTDSYADTLAASEYVGNAVDFVLIDGNHAPSGNYYPSVRQRTGRGQYTIESATHTADLDSGANGTYIMTPDDVVRVWDVSLANGTTYYLSVKPIAGDADLSIALHKSQPSSSATWYQGRSSSVAFANYAGSGGTGFLSHTPTENDWYGFIVINNGATTGTSYTIYMDTTPPSGSFQINNGNTYANSTNVTLNVSAADSDTGLQDMRFKNATPLRALVLQDSYPWDSHAIQELLAANSIPYDQRPSSDIAAINLSPYSIVIIPSIQGDTFCNRYNSNLTKFTSYVQSGGVLELHGATFSSDTCRPMLPGGGTNSYNGQAYNYIVSPAHPLVAGVSNPFKGSYASHNSFTGYPAGATVVATAGDAPGGHATLIEYPLGAGYVIATGQTLEISLDYGWAGGTILTNVIPYAARHAATHLTWSTAASWQLSASNGVKRVYGEFRNNAGIWSAVYNDTITLDTVLPTASASCPAETEEESFVINWSGSDSLSGVASYDVQYRVGTSDAWMTWKQNTTATSATFGPNSPVTVEGGRTYYFRARAKDQAGNTGQYATGNGDCSTHVAGASAVYIPLILRNHIAYAAACGPTNNYCEDYDASETAYGPLKPGQAYQAYPNDEKDYYYFLVLNTASVTVRVTNYQAVGQLIVRREDLSVVGQDVEDPITDGILQVTSNLSPGKYYVQIYTTSGYHQNTLYSLTVNQ
jgi:hypothetical protein